MPQSPGPAPGPSISPGLSISATGHRPNKLGGYSPATDKRLFQLAHGWLAVQSGSLGPGIREVVSGMALGWDLAVAEAALALELPLICAIPFPNQPAYWPPESIKQWKAVRAKASEVHIIAQHYSPQAMQARNEWMVDRADEILALWNGTPGGTFNCLRHNARTAKKPVTNLWKDFSQCQ